VADRAMLMAAWVIFNDRDFMRQHHHAIDPEDVPRGPLRWLFAEAVRLWREEKSLLTPDVFALVYEDADYGLWGTTLEEVRDLYLDVQESRSWNEDDKEALRNVARKWLRGLHLGRRVSEAGSALEIGDYETAERSLRRSSAAQQEYGPGMGWGPKRFPPQTRAVPLGVRYFERKWLGGIHLGQLGMVLAPSNTGKSMWLPYFTAQALRARMNVLYYTTELTEADVFKRVLSAILQEPINSIRDIPEAEARALTILQRRIAEEPEDREFFEVRFRDPAAISPLDIATDLEVLRDQGVRIHLVICDGDDLAPTVANRNDRFYEIYKNVYAQLSALAKGQEVAIWTAAQANKDAYKTPYVKPYQVADSLWKLRLVDLAIAINMHRRAVDEQNEPFMPVTVIKDRYYGTRGKGLRVYPLFGVPESPGIVGFEREQEEEDPDALGL
jgi:hypothetical protein